MEEGAGRRGIPSLLKSQVPAEIEAASLQQEHIASDITQVRPSSLSVRGSWHRFPTFFQFIYFLACLHFFCEDLFPCILVLV